MHNPNIIIPNDKEEETAIERAEKQKSRER